MAFRYNVNMLSQGTLAARAVRYSVALTAFSLFACDRGPSAPTWHDGLPGQWHAGDFHVHTVIGSNDTRGEDEEPTSFPETIKRIGLERGLSFVVITDHSNSAGSVTHTTKEYGDQWNQGPEFPLWDVAARLSDADFLMIDGSEISPVSYLEPEQCIDCSQTGDELAPTGHIGCSPRDLETFDLDGAFIDRPPAAVTGASAIDQCHDRGGFAVLNHPTQEIAQWISYDWTGYHYDAIEVWNGGMGFDPTDTGAFDSYLCDRLAGRTPVAVGGSDNHRTLLPYDGMVNLDPPLGFPKTSVFASVLSWPAIMESVQAGRIVVHDEGTFVDFRVFDAENRYVAGIGDTLRVSQLPVGKVTILARGRSALEQDLQLVYVAPDACVDGRREFAASRPEVASTAERQKAVCVDDAPCSFDLAFEVDLKPGLYYMTVGVPRNELGQRDLAFTNVLTVK